MGTANLSNIKTVDKSFVVIGDTVNYTIVMTNSGDADAINILFTDLIPQGANFIPNSIFINGTNSLGTNPALGVAIPTIPVGSTTTITMQSLVVNVPTVNPMSNSSQLDYQFDSSLTTIPNLVAVNSVSTSVLTTISNPNLLLKKSVNQTQYALGTTLTYSINLQNVGSTSADNITFIDTIPVGTQFVTDSVSVNGTNLPGESPLPPSGVNLGTLSGGFQVTLRFDVIVTSIPSPTTLTNACDVAYEFVVNPNIGNISSSRITSNQVTTAFGSADLSGITKSVDKIFADCHDTLTYTIILPNSGALTATNVVFSDTLSNGLSFVSGSITVNNISIGGTPSSISVGTIPPNGVATITFKAQINC